MPATFSPLYVVRDCFGEFVGIYGRRTEDIGEAAQYETREEADAARERQTDQPQAVTK